jgi:transposase
MEFYHFQSYKKAPFCYMTFSKDLRWRALILFEFQGMDIRDVSYLLGVSVPSIRNWVSQFKSTGTVEPARTRRQQTRWPTEVVDWVRTWIKANPQFIFDELIEELQELFPNLNNISQSTVCRALKYDLGITRKVYICLI